MMTRTTIVAVASLLAACAGFEPPKNLPVGAPEAEVTKLMGPPTGRYALSGGGERLEYARGRETYMVDLDAQRRVVQWDQVLDRATFDTISAGITSEQLLRTLGRPSQRSGMRGGEIWSWQYATADCLWWQAQVDTRNVVTAAGYSPAPWCNK